MKIIEALRSRNRTLLELHIGILFWAMAAAIVGSILPLDAWGLGRGAYLCSIAAAALGAAAAAVHMQRCLERALGLDEKSAGKLITRGYLIRYAVFVIIAIVSAAGDLLNPLVLCLGYILLMKAAAYSQPFTHKLCNKLFHETDPVPEPVSDEEWNRK